MVSDGGPREALWDIVSDVANDPGGAWFNGDTETMERVDEVLDGLRSWPALMAILDERYPPPDVFGEAGEDRADLDPGVRIIRLVREVERLTQENARLTAKIENLTNEVAFQNEMRELATKTAATIADLDEQAPALRQMLRAERERRQGAEAAADRAIESLSAVIKNHEGWRDVIEKAKALRDGQRRWLSEADFSSEDLRLLVGAVCAAVDALTQPEEPEGEAT